MPSRYSTSEHDTNICSYNQFEGQFICLYDGISLSLLNSDCRNITTTINACLLRIKGFTVLLLRSVLSSQIWKGMATCKASGRVLLGRVVSVP